MNLLDGRVFDSAAGICRRHSRHIHACAARHASARSRHRLHRSRNRTNCRLRSLARQPAWVRARGHSGPGCRTHSGARRCAAPDLDRAHLARSAGSRDRRDVRVWAQPGASCCSRATSTVQRTLCAIFSLVRSCGHSRRVSSGRPAVYAVILALWFGARERMGQVGFYALFAVAVTVSVQLVGLYLVFATLIVPPLATRRMARRRLAAAWLLGVAGYAVGLVISHGARPTDRPGNRLGAGGACVGMASSNASTPCRDWITDFSASINGTG